MIRRIFVASSQINNAPRPVVLRNQHCLTHVRAQAPQRLERSAMILAARFSAGNHYRHYAKGEEAAA
jgi:hypothetical protein